MFLLIYAFVLVVIFSLAYTVYKLSARWGRLHAGVATALTLGLGVLIWPIPIHGGFTFLFVAAWDELSRNYQQTVEIKQSQKERAFLSKLNRRFKGALDIYPRQQINSHWLEVQAAHGARAWFDESSKMVWSELIVLQATAELPSLEMAKATCVNLQPSGYWALPTEAENYTRWRSGGSELLPNGKHSVVSYLVDEQLGLELSTYVLGKKSANTDIGTSQRNSFAVRCIARTKEAPPRGYIKSDIALDDWNEYQLQKIIR